MQESLFLASWLFFVGHAAAMPPVHSLPMDSILPARNIGLAQNHIINPLILPFMGHDPLQTSEEFLSARKTQMGLTFPKLTPSKQPYDIAPSGTLDGIPITRRWRRLALAGPLTKPGPRPINGSRSGANTERFDLQKLITNSVAPGQPGREATFHPIELLASSPTARSMGQASTPNLEIHTIFRDFSAEPPSPPHLPSLIRKDRAPVLRPSLNGPVAQRGAGHSHAEARVEPPQTLQQEPTSILRATRPTAPKPTSMQPAARPEPAQSHAELRKSATAERVVTSGFRGAQVLPREGSSAPLPNVPWRGSTVRQTSAHDGRQAKVDQAPHNPQTINAGRVSILLGHQPVQMPVEDSGVATASHLPSVKTSLRGSAEPVGDETISRVLWRHRVEHHQAPPVDRVRGREPNTQGVEQGPASKKARKPS